jgi:hypothetical protein
MLHERTNPARPAQGRTNKRCPACGERKSLIDFYTTVRGGPSGYCKGCQRAVSRLSSRRRQAAVRLLAAAHPEEWADALRQAREERQGRQGGDAA